MTSNDTTREAVIRSFYTAFSGENAKPLDPGHRFYVPILDQKPEADPILALKTRIEWEISESTNLLTGFRGNGKSTELRRLKKLLEDDGCRVFLIDMLEFILVSKPVELSDFILSLMAGIAHSIKQESDLDVVRKDYWERFRHFFESEVVSDGLTLSAGTEEFSAELGLRLKTDPTFKDRIQQQLSGHITTLVKDARDFISAVVDRLRVIEADPDLKVVLLVDSVEQLRGHGEDAGNVQNSVVELFSGQAANLSFPKLHVVYTIPPYMTAIAPCTGRAFGGSPIASWPNVHVRQKNGDDDPQGLSIMQEIVSKRYPEWERFFDKPSLSRLAKSSGGDLRDYFRLIRECLIVLRNKPSLEKVDNMVLDLVEAQLRKELTPIAADDARWLLKINECKTTALQTIGDLPRLARFLDNNLVMNYLNGESWYDLHPLILREISGYRTAPNDTPAA